MATIYAGELRQRLAVQAKTEERDASGGVIEAWQTTMLRWASIEPLRGRELFSAQEVDARITHRVTMRYIATLTPTQRLLYRNRVLHILSVMNVGEDDIMTQCLCMEDA